MTIWDVLARAVSQGGSIELPAGRNDEDIAELVKLGFLERLDSTNGVQAFRVTSAGARIAVVYDRVLDIEGGLRA